MHKQQQTLAIYYEQKHFYMILYELITVILHMHI